MNSEKLEINNFLNVRGEDTESTVVLIVSKITDSDVGFAGFENSHELKGLLLREIEGDIEKTEKIEEWMMVESEIREVISRCQNIVSADKTHIFLFPTFSKFVRDEMSGITGFTPWKNTIHVYINFLEKNWKRVLRGTIFHEYCHSVMFSHHEWNTNLDTLIFEGMAELFREENLGGENPPWISVFTIEKGREIFSEISSRLGESNLFDSNTETDLPLWTKYTLGYQIVTSFRKKHPNISWSDLVKFSPKEILQGSEYNSLPFGI
jgi:uncharacterized protein YjaZ